LLDDQRRVETTDVVGVAADHDGALAPGREHDGRIDHVGRSRSSAENPRGLREHTIERRNLGRRTRQKCAKRYLPGAIAPDLSHDTGGDHESGADTQCFATERTHPSVPSLEGDERARV
jgi:hypothetical protein